MGDFLTEEEHAQLRILWESDSREAKAERDRIYMDAAMRASQQAPVLETSEQGDFQAKITVYRAFGILESHSRTL